MFEDMNFQRIVLTIAGILLLGFLAVVAYSMIKANAVAGEWPPVISNCPDNWVITEDGKCSNPNGISTTCSAASYDFTTKNYLGQSGLCEKSKWAQGCKINWDGISNNPNACTVAP
jgi:hypothetical protein